MEQLQQQPSNKSIWLKRSVIVNIIALHLIISAFVICTHLFVKFFPESVVTQILNALWELSSIFITICLPVSTIIFIIKILKKDWDLLVAYGVSLQSEEHTSELQSREK